MIRKKRQYSKPRTKFQSERIKDENKLVAKYGLKNKKEIWKTEAKVKYFRNRAKTLITAEQEEKQKFFDKLNAIGLKVSSIADVLALGVEDLLKRRLSTIVQNKGIAHTTRQARQMIVHKKITVGSNVVNIPSYIVKVIEENEIGVRKKEKKAPALEAAPAEESSEAQNESPVEEKEETQVENTEEVKEDKDGGN